MRTIRNSTVSVLCFLLAGCIGTDIVFDTIDPEIRLMDYVNVLGVDDTYQFRASYFNNVGSIEDVELMWMSSDTSIVEVDENGMAYGKRLGNAVISISYESEGELLRLDHPLEVGPETILIENASRAGSIQTTSSYALQGDFVLQETEDGLVLSFAANYIASTALPGLYIYLTNNPTTTMGAYEIGAVTVYSGEHSYDLPPSIGLNDYEYVLYFCKPFNVKVGDGQIN